jgi:hypothetical protein
VVGKARDAGGYADRSDGLQPGLNSQVPGHLPQLVGASARHLRGCPGEYEHELLTAVATRDVVASRPFLKKRPEGTEQLVTQLMAEVIIDFFEMIQIEHHHRHRRVASKGTPHLAL